MEGGRVSPTADQVHTEREFITGDVLPGSSAYQTNNRGDLGVLEGIPPEKKKNGSHIKKCTNDTLKMSVLD